MAELNIHSWFGEHSHRSRVGQRVIRGSSPVSVSASNVPSNAGNATFSAIEETNRAKRPVTLTHPLQLILLYHEKLLYSQTSDREKNINFCAVLSGDNKDADIMQQPASCRASSRRFRLRSTRRALSGSKVKSRIALTASAVPAFCIDYTIYASGEIGLLLSQYHYPQDSSPFP
jgi:hypothetical protein